MYAACMDDLPRWERAEEALVSGRDDLSPEELDSLRGEIVQFVDDAILVEARRTVKTVCELRDSAKSEKTRLSAALAVLDRVLPRKSVTAGGEGPGVTIHIDRDSAVALAEALRAGSVAMEARGWEEKLESPLLRISGESS